MKVAKYRYYTDTSSIGIGYTEPSRFGINDTESSSFGIPNLADSVYRIYLGLYILGNSICKVAFA